MDGHEDPDVLHARNLVVVTSDQKFVEHVIDKKVVHVGVVYIPAGMSVGEKVHFAQIACAWVYGDTRDSAE
jgi:hypothetical protein